MDEVANGTTPINVQPVFAGEQPAPLAILTQAAELGPSYLELSETLDWQGLHDSIIEATKSDTFTQGMQEKLNREIPPTDRTLEEGLLQYQGHTYVPDQEALCLQVIWDHHDHPTARHFGEAKTTDLICHGFHWLGLRHMVIDYVRSCTRCARSKAPITVPYGLLKQLPIPNQPWDSISMDFIEQLPPSEGFTAILVIINRLTKQACSSPPMIPLTHL